MHWRTVVESWIIRQYDGSCPNGDRSGALYHELTHPELEQLPDHKRRKEYRQERDQVLNVDCTLSGSQLPQRGVPNHGCHLCATATSSVPRKMDGPNGSEVSRDPGIGRRRLLGKKGLVIRMAVFPRSPGSCPCHAS